MGWLTLLQALLSVARVVADYLRDKQLIDAGEAKAIAEGLKGSLDAIERANKARSKAISRFDAANGVPDDKDPNLRD